MALSFTTKAQTSNGGAARDGKLLRSELWQPFDAKAVKGDFFVSPNGNDSWSGTLDAPNASKTDGPFATINRAKLAVRELKSKVYLPKDKPIDARYAGTNYPFGKGKDIVVFIRTGFYPLKESLVFSPEDGGERVETNLPSGAFDKKSPKKNEDSKDEDSIYEFVIWKLITSLYFIGLMKLEFISFGLLITFWRLLLCRFNYKHCYVKIKKQANQKPLCR
jgi:hypothetical protein